MKQHKPPEATIPELKEVLSSAFLPQMLRVTRDYDGSIDLRILSALFEEVAEPEEVLKKAVSDAGFSLPDRTLILAKSPSEIEEEDRDLFEPQQIMGTPTWGDALLREPEGAITDDRNFDRKVVAFWGVKGGVGRSTALSHVAAILGRRHQKVLAIDLDLDSPGLVATLAEESEVGGYPRFEDLIRQTINEGADADLKKVVSRALRRSKDKQARLDILGPASADREFVKSLLGPLAPSSLYRGGISALRRLIRIAISAAEADIVLVDARSGYCDESAMAVLDLADEVALFVSPAPSTYLSLDPAIEALERNRRAIGRPRLVHVVAGMLPAGVEARRRILEELVAVIANSRAEVAKALATSESELPPDITESTILGIEYTARIVENEGQLLLNVTDIYKELASRISPVPQISTSLAADISWVSEVLQEARIPVAQAEDEESSEKLAQLFTSTRELEEFVRQDVCLVLGAKGTGKSYLRRMCLEYPDILAARSRTRALENVLFVDGYSQERHGVQTVPPITSDLLRQIDKGLGNSWRDVWSALALGRALTRLRDSGVEISDILRRGKDLGRLLEADQRKLLEAVRKSIADPLLLDSAWKAVDEACARAGKTLTLLFDDLDVALGESEADIQRRGILIQALIERNNNSWIRHRHLSAKIFLREDLFQALDLEEAAKYQTRSVTLRWAPEEIWRLVIRAMAVASPRFAQIIESKGLDPDNLEAYAEEQTSAALELIWGERLGDGESQTRSLIWAQGRLRDGANRMFPRAVLWLLQFALAERRKRGAGEKLPILDPASLRAAMPGVSQQRLIELNRECTPKERARINQLKGFASYQNEADFLLQLRKVGESDPEDALKTFKSLGIVESGSRRNGTPTVRIVDLYAFAPSLEIKRVGRR